MKTPQLPAPVLAEALGVPEIYLKREDQHHFWSHKGRSIPRMIDAYRQDGIKNFVISSSGNAALAAVLAIQIHNKNSDKEPLSLTVFVGQKINDEKLRTLKAVIEDPRISLSQVERPKQAAMQMEKETGTKNLRQSTDDLALEGYRELAMELDHIPNLEAIFIPTSSGTTAQALGMYFKELTHHPQIHIVQTTSCHPIANAFATSVSEATNHLPPLASAIVDRVAHRKNAVVNVVKESKGFGWIVADEEIESAILLVEETKHLLISPNSALSVAGLMKAVKNGWKWRGAVVCIITGQ